MTDGFAFLLGSLRSLLCKMDAMTPDKTLTNTCRKISDEFIIECQTIVSPKIFRGLAPSNTVWGKLKCH